jgi:hypothetical protein
METTMLSKALAAVLITSLCSATSFAQNGSSAAPSPVPQQAANRESTTATPRLKGFGLEDGTPVKLRTARTISSADAHVGDTLDFEVLEDVFAKGVLVIGKGGIAWGTVTEAQAKRRMARGGKLNINIDSVRLLDGEKAALRAVKDGNGGGHTGAMVGGMVATSIVFFPAAPFFLFMHGKDITIPKGTEITAYVNGTTRLDQAKFQPAETEPASASQSNVVTTLVDISSTPAGGDIEIDGKFIGDTPSSISLTPGEHEVAIKKSGFAPWDKKISVSTGHINLSPELTPEPK